VSKGNRPEDWVARVPVPVVLGFGIMLAGIVAQFLIARQTQGQAWSPIEKAGLWIGALVLFGGLICKVIVSSRDRDKS
jgi:hypothetical protein